MAGLGAGVLDDAEEHPSRSGDRILHFTPASNDLENFRANLLTVTLVHVEHLTKGSGVETEVLETNQRLVRADMHGGVEALRRLRK